MAYWTVNSTKWENARGSDRDGTMGIKAIVIPHGIQEHYSVGFANALADNGIDMDFVRSENTDPGLLRKSISWVDLGQNKREDIPGSLKLIKLIAYHARLIWYVLVRPRRIVHVIGTFRFELLMGVLEGILFRLIGRRYYLTVHNIVPHDSNKSGHKRLYRFIYRIPHKLIVHTERMRKELIGDFGIDPEKIITMHHGLNDAVPDVSLTQSECRRQLGITGQGPVLLFFGNVAPYKGLDILLDALQDNENVRLLIAGKAKSAEYHKEIKERIRTHSQRERITERLGWVENDLVPVYLCAADALVMPYRHIDQSGVLFLGLRYGIPIIAFNVGAIKEYVPDSVGVVTDDQSVDGLKSAIKKFCSNQDAYDRRHILAHADSYRWDNVIEPVIQLYKMGQK